MLYTLPVFRHSNGYRGVNSLPASLAIAICLGLAAIFSNCSQPGTANAAEIVSQSSMPDRPLSADPAAGRRITAPIAKPAVSPHPKFANFEGEHKSRNAQLLADWVADSRDNRGMPFAIVDKVDAKVFVFDAYGRLRGAAPVLLGLARGDYAVSGIGNRKLADIRPDERTTPAGRFVAYLGYNAKRKDVLWVDFNNAVSLHRVITNNPVERRLERLATASPADKRISYGCINVPAVFFDTVVKPSFTRTYGIVYVLPDTQSIGEIFKPCYDVAARWSNRSAANDGIRGQGPLAHRAQSADNRFTSP